MSVKETYWKNGVILRFNSGRKRIVWGNNAIDICGCIPKYLFDDDLVCNNESKEYVVEIYSPNVEAMNFCGLLDLSKERLLWSKCNYIFTAEQARKLLSVPSDEEFIIINTKEEF